MPDDVAGYAVKIIIPRRALVVTLGGEDVADVCPRHALGYLVALWLGRVAAVEPLADALAPCSRGFVAVTKEGKVFLSAHGRIFVLT